MIVDLHADQAVASSAAGQFVAEDPVAVLGLVRLVELRGAERMARDEDIAGALERFPNFLGMSRPQSGRNGLALGNRSRSDTYDVRRG